MRDEKCGCGRQWQTDIRGRKWLYDADEHCAWLKCTGDVICNNYEKPPNYGLNPINSYLDLAVKTTCRCQPSISTAKHGRVKKSRSKHLNYGKMLLRPENIDCPWGDSSCQRFCQTCFHYCGVEHGTGPI